MKKLSKILIILMVAIIAINSMSVVVNAGNTQTSSGPTAAIDDISADTSKAANASTDLKTVVGKFLGLVQIASAVLAVVLIAWFGFNYILQSPSKKPEYMNNFVPLIAGIILTFMAVSIAKLIFSILG